MPGITVHKHPGGTCQRCGVALVRHESIIAWSRNPNNRGAWHHPSCSDAWTVNSPEWIAYKSEKKNIPTPTATPSLTGGLAETLAEALKPYLQGQLDNKVDVDTLDKLIEERLALLTMPTILEIVLPDKTKIDLGTTHRQFAEILPLVQANLPVYMYSHLPGTGKSTIAEQCAKALGITYYSVTFAPSTPEWKIFGHPNADGQFVESDFYNAYVKGGLFFVDEYDNGSASLITTLNQALANGYCSFPVVGMVERHPMFRFLAAGNTPARGANPRFPDRRPQDGASLDRLAYIEVNVDEAMETALAMAYTPNAKPWVTWVQSVRKVSLEKYPKLIASPRASLYGAQLLAVNANYSHETLAEMLVFKGLDTATKTAVLTACPLA